MDGNRGHGDMACGTMTFVVDRMRPWSFPGSYADERGCEPIVWQVEPFDTPDMGGNYELRTVVRGIPIGGGQFDALGPDPGNSRACDSLPLDRFNDLTSCTLGGELPCAIEVRGIRRTEIIRFTFELNPDPEPDKMHLAVTIDGTTYETDCDALETGLAQLATACAADTSLVCCFTCLYSDYSPASSLVMGMRCHRDAKEQYLAVRSKADIWSVPVTEHVPETYLCPQYRLRIAGTGYRG
ncbi:DUF6304 family protein [Nocardia sp. NPDC056000]|uniref:DUF6304 family protein n=1 Tax=Nocardia sp. NPDC056000 TaxID=3345674 RepID=UPI0035DD9AD1